MFTSSNPQNIDELLIGIDSRVSEDMNRELIKPVNAVEIKQAIFSIKRKEKAPGANGMTGVFFSNILEYHW